ncbi:MAG: glycine--tRNA ligase subunit alpha, partial [Pseudomonadota bacterium]
MVLPRRNAWLNFPPRCAKARGVTQPLSFQRMILTLHEYWSQHGCLILQPYDMEMG